MSSYQCGDPDLVQVGFGSVWSDLDPSRSFGSSRSDLSDSLVNCNPSYSKSAGSDIPDFTSMEALFNGP
jgi:hypothetical protein